PRSDGGRSAPARLESGDAADVPRVGQWFAAYPHRSPTALGEAVVRAFLDHLVAERHVSRATHGVDVAALHCLYRVTLDRPDVVRRIRYLRRATERLPEILSPGEVERLLA